MHRLTQPMSALLVHGTKRFSACWKIERPDGVTMRFTDHDKALEVDGEVYEPVVFDASARQKQDQLQAQNVEARGALSSAAITHADLRAGRYRRAKITEIVVDWRYTFNGTYQTQKYWVTEVRYTGEDWQAELRGLLSFLTQEVGRTYNKLCDADLGDSRCTVNLAALTVTGVAVTSVQTERRLFRCSSLASYADGHFTLGEVHFTSGANNGFRFDIKRFRGTLGGSVQLQLRAPYDIAVGDTLTIKPGCNKLSGVYSTVGHCKHRYNNLINFQGFPTIPGNDRVLQTPNAK